MSERKTLVRQLTEKMAQFNRDNDQRIKRLEQGQQVDGTFYPDSHNPSGESVEAMAVEFSRESVQISTLMAGITSMEPDPLPEPRNPDAL